MQSAPSGTGRICCRKATLRRGILHSYFSNGACCFSQPAWTTPRTLQRGQAFKPGASMLWTWPAFSVAISIHLTFRSIV